MARVEAPADAGAMVELFGSTRDNLAKVKPLDVALSGAEEATVVVGPISSKGTWGRMAQTVAMEAMR